MIEQHPEYHAYLTDQDQLQRDFTQETVKRIPWLHMGMHISLGEQLGADRPAGIRDIYAEPPFWRPPCRRTRDDGLSQGRPVGGTAFARMPDEQAYLECLKKLL